MSSLLKSAPDDLKLLEKFQDRVLWLSTRMSPALPIGYQSQGWNLAGQR